MDESDEDYRGLSGLIARIKDTLLKPFYLLISPAFLRTYLRTILVLLTSTLLFGTAIVAYTTFYYTYIPIRGISVPVYLQFAPEQHIPTYSAAPSPETLRKRQVPYGVANIRGLANRQKYDVEVALELPRSRHNLEAGNWMVGLELRGPQTKGGGIKGVLGWEEEWDVEDYSYGAESGVERDAIKAEGPGRVEEKPVVLARSRRPAILRYRSFVTESVWRAVRLPWYVIGWGEEKEQVIVGMMEGVEFDKGSTNLPASLRVELRAKHPLEVYAVNVRFAARLEGLRWVMYKYKISSFVVFTSMFWGVEMALLLMTWGFFTLVFGGGAQPEERKAKLKIEPGLATPKTEPASSVPSTPLSDASRTFPTLSSQHPLHYASSSGDGARLRVKEERETPAVEDVPEVEADDEDEDADFLLEPVPHTSAGVLTDSGIGTSLESGIEGRGVRRRKSERSTRRED